MSIKSSLIDYMAGNPGVGVPVARLEQCTHALQAFVAAPQFDDAVIRANNSSYTRISIVMPSFNQVQFIERSILSVLNQNYPNLQFIIMDGGSNDGTIEIVRRYERYLTWRSEPDGGQSDAINKALQLADGDLIGWLNSDDVYFPGAFFRISALARKLPNAVLYSGSTALIDRNEQLLNVPRYVRLSSLRLLHQGFMAQSQGVFWRRLSTAPPVLCDPSLHYAMDIDLWLKLLSHGKAEFTPELIGALRYYEGTKTESAPEKGRAEVTAVRRKYGVDDTTLKWRVMRNLLFASSVAERTFLTRRHCVIAAQEAYEP